MARLEVVIFGRYLRVSSGQFLACNRVSSLVTFCVRRSISSMGCHLLCPTSHPSAPPVQGLSKWSWQSSSAIVVAAYSMGARHLRVSDVPKSEQVFLTLLEVAGRTFSWEVRRSKCSRCSPLEGISIYPVFGHPSNYQGTCIWLMNDYRSSRNFCWVHCGFYLLTNSWKFDLHQAGLQVFLEVYSDVLTLFEAAKTIFERVSSKQVFNYL